MKVYYNEIDKFCCKWLERLIVSGQIPGGKVHKQDIRLVKEDNARGYDTRHYFAGIGGWPYALRLAGWPATRPVWTASCPCQPYSSAGKKKGNADERNLWPFLRPIIAECRPATIFGEQVASKDGRRWFSGVRSDLEALGYAVGASDLCAAGEGAPHIRQRLFWVGNSDGPREMPIGEFPERTGTECERSVGGVGNSVRQGLERLRCGPRNEHRPCSGREPSVAASPWARYDVIPCRDHKNRRVEPGTFPLATGFPGRVGLIKGYGNAIVPQVAATFIRAFMDIYPEVEAPRDAD